MTSTAAAEETVRCRHALAGRRSREVVDVAVTDFSRRRRRDNAAQNGRHDFARTRLHEKNDRQRKYSTRK